MPRAAPTRLASSVWSVIRGGNGSHGPPMLVAKSREGGSAAGFGAARNGRRCCPDVGRPSEHGVIDVDEA